MPEISFYVLTTSNPQARFLFVCKLVEKAYRSNTPVFIQCQSNAECQQLDNLLWTFRPGSFIPHQIFTGVVPAIKHLTLISTLPAPVSWQNTIVNLSSNIPKITPQIGKILEILDDSESIKQAGRHRYRHYQQAGCQINTYKI